MIAQPEQIKGGRHAVILQDAALIVACLATLALVLAALMPPRLEADLSSTRMTADDGFAFIAPVELKPPFGFRVVGDDAGHAPASTLLLRENGKPLGPAQASHAAIRTDGGGRYSHWGTRIWLSASDSSDPRSNGRRYSLRVTASLQPWLFPIVALVDALALFVIWPRLTDSRFRRRLLDGTLVIAVMLTVLIATGAFGRINEGGGEPKDAALVVATLLHALGGATILLAQWAAGAGAARLLLKGQATFANVLTLGFALSLPIAAVLAVVTLELPYGFLISAGGWMLCCLPLRNWRPPNGDWEALAETAVSSLPLALGFGCWIGLLWHGPTATLGGSPSGDLVYYSTGIVSLSTQLFPYLNLGYAYHPLNLYFNMLFPLLGAALSRVVALDPFLFIAAAGATSLILSLSMMLHLYVKGTGIFAGKRVSGVATATVVLAFIVANRYPYWSVESIPVIHAVPLVIAVVYWAGKSEAWARVVAFAIALVGSAFSKVASAAVLVPFVAATAVSQLLQMSRAAWLPALAVALVALAYAAAMLYAGSLNFSAAPLGPVTFQMLHYNGADVMTVVPHLMRDLSALSMAALAFLLTDRLRAMAIALGCLLFLVYSFLFLIDWVCAAIILGLVACDDLDRLQRYRVSAMAAYLLALPAVLSDPAGLSSGIAWLICAGGAVLISLRPPAWLPGDRVRIAAALLVLCLGLAGVARGNLIVTSGWEAGVLTPKVREIWLAVKDRTPPDSLIFTDQTGSEPTLLGSWNTYAFIGARQIFVSNLYINPVTRFDGNRRKGVLQENDAVLQGSLLPDRLALPRRYSAYYAVVSCARAVPRVWRRIFSNDVFCLYEMEAGR